MGRDNLAHGLGTYTHQNGTVYQGREGRTNHKQDLFKGIL